MGEGVHTLSRKQRESRNIDAGLNKAEKFTIHRIENDIRRNKLESAYFVDDEGRIVGTAIDGTETYVKIPKSEAKPNTVMIHNHPGKGLSDSIAGRIGSPFSSFDVDLAVKANVKEIRAVTKTYTYSLKRPKGGWGDPKKIEKAIEKMKTDRRSARKEYLNAKENITKYPYSPEDNDRANLMSGYKAMQRIAKRFGWKFSRKKTA